MSLIGYLKFELLRYIKNIVIIFSSYMFVVAYKNAFVLFQKIIRALVSAPFYRLIAGRVRLIAVFLLVLNL